MVVDCVVGKGVVGVVSLAVRLNVPPAVLGVLLDPALGALAVLV